MLLRKPTGAMKGIKPGHQLEPIQAVHTCDPQEAIDRCLECTEKKCSGTCAIEDHELQRTRRRKERDEKILNLILEGGMSDRKICERLGIGKSTLYEAKKRLKNQGVIE